MASARIRARFIRLFLAIGAGWLGAGPAFADESSAVDEIVAVLKQKGLIDEATGDEILAKQAKADAKKAEAKEPSPVPALLDGFDFAGDFRVRYEQFWYGKGLQGVEADDNNRVRYRVRFGFTKQIVPWALIGVRVVTDTNDYRSTNISVGQNPDFSFDNIFLDRAYAQFNVPAPDVQLNTTVLVGKFTNPFIWRATMDKIIWDEDVSLEGIAITPTWTPTESTRIWGNFGYFVELQQASLVDPRLWAYQLNAHQNLFDEMVEVAARVSYYDWEHLENDPNVAATPTSLAQNGFFARTFANGNQPIGFKNNSARFVETTAYANFRYIENWPILIWGTYVNNLSARSGVVAAVPVDAQNEAWGVGVEFGNARKWARLGMVYHSIEANGVIAEYTDSDMFDGLTNRREYGFYGARELVTNLELRIFLWGAHTIKTTQSGVGDGPYNISSTTDSRANRKRLQVDLNFLY